MQSQAIIFHEANRPSLESVTLPEAGPSDVVIEIHYSGISAGTETSVITGARTHNGTFPLVSGYMAAGEVLSVGKEVRDIAPGDRVVSWGSRLASVNAVWGAHVAHHICDSSSVTRVPDEVPLSQAAAWVPPRVGLHAVEVAGISEEDTVLVSGQGVIGYFFALWARLRGAKVIALEPDANRGEIARRQGSITVIDPTAPSLDESVFTAGGGRWPTVVVEATGNKALIPQTLRFIKNTGTRAVFLSWYPGDITLDFGRLHNQEVTAFFPTGAGSNETGLSVLDALANKKLDMEEPLLEIFPLAQAEELFARVARNDRSLMSAVIDWRATS
jgi:3-hydroxyethyl bacteriochlorophyllide a dehydrogenase